MVPENTVTMVGSPLDEPNEDRALANVELAHGGQSQAAMHNSVRSEGSFMRSQRRRQRLDARDDVCLRCHAHAVFGGTVLASNRISRRIISNPTDSGHSLIGPALPPVRGQGRNRVRIPCMSGDTLGDTISPISMQHDAAECACNPSRNS